MGVKISELTSMGTLAGTEKLAGVDSGTQYTTPADLKTYLDQYYLTLATATPVSWTPTFTGFGTVSGIKAYSWRVGSELFYEVTWTCGTTTATEARMSLGYNGTDGNVTSASTYATLTVSGTCVSDINTAIFYTLSEASKTYITFGQANPGGTAGLAKRNASAIFDTGGVLSVKGSIRIQGW